MEVTDPSYFGTISLGEAETEEHAAPSDPNRKVTVTRQSGEWRPPARIAQFLPDGFSVLIDCYTAADGLRRIVPRHNFEELIDLGAVGGLAVLHGLRGFNKEVDHSYRAMQLIHRHVRGRVHLGTRGMREHLIRKFECSRDLYIRSPGRLSDGERDVLPDDVGLDADGKGKRLSVKQVTELGRQAAIEAGHDTPTSNLAIPYGFYEAAKNRPLEISPEEVRTLVRMTLFDVDSIEDELSEELVDIVTERLLETIQRHLDDSREEFDRWFTGPSNSLVKQISQRKRKRGGQLPREEVRRALLHIGWKAYEYAGQCLHALMRTIKSAMPDPLNDEERQLFERMHESQPYYGNLPLALLAERASFLQPAVLAIWNDPTNQDHVAVLHRLLAYYAEMARSRREADRRSKQRCQGTSSTSSKGGSTADPVKRQDAESAAALAYIDRFGETFHRTR